MRGSVPVVRFGFLFLAFAVLAAIWFGPAEQINTAQERVIETPKAKFEQFSKRDDVTKDIRDRTKEIVRVDVHSIADRENVTKYGRIVQDFGSSVILATVSYTHLRAHETPEHL